MPKLKKNQEKRVRLSSRGPHISTETMKFLNLWRGAYGLPYGRSIDCAIAHACRDAAFQLSLSGSRPSLKAEPLPLATL